MLVLSSIFVILYGGVFGGSLFKRDVDENGYDYCNEVGHIRLKKSYRRCVPGGSFKLEFRDVDIDAQLDSEICPTLLPYMECVKEYADECGTEKAPFYELMSGKFDRLNALLQELCDENSPKRPGLIQQLHCLQNVMNNYVPCQTRRRHAQYVYRNYTISLDDYSFQYYHEKYFCFHKVYDEICFIEQFTEECGGDYLDVALYANHRYCALWLYPCDDEDREAILSVIDILQLETKEKLQLKNILSDKYEKVCVAQ